MGAVNSVNERACAVCITDSRRLCPEVVSVWHQGSDEQGLVCVRPAPPGTANTVAAVTALTVLLCYLPRESKGETRNHRKCPTCKILY